MKQQEKNVIRGSARGWVICLCAVASFGCASSTKVIDLSVESETDRMQLEEIVSDYRRGDVVIADSTVRARLEIIDNSLRVIPLRRERGRFGRTQPDFILSTTHALSDVPVLRFERRRRRRTATQWAVGIGIAGGALGGLFAAALNSDCSDSSSGWFCEQDLSSGEIATMVGATALSGAVMGAAWGALVAAKETVVVNLSSNKKVIARGRSVGLTWTVGR